jgi:uncharacterized damage-inducible protein DinB
VDNLLQNTMAVLATTPQRWLNLAQTLPPELLAAEPAPGEWSALGCLAHIVDTEHVLQTRLASFLAGKDFLGFNPDSEGTKAEPADAVALVQKFASMRRESLASLTSVTEADFDRRVRHQELGPVTLREMIHEWAAHDLNHTVQAERALMQPFLAGCGPWQQFFTDHLQKA